LQSHCPQSDLGSRSAKSKKIDLEVDINVEDVLAQAERILPASQITANANGHKFIN